MSKLKYVPPEPSPPTNRSPLKVRCKRALLLPDIHMPYHSSEAVSCAIEYGLTSQCDCVIITGDALDFYQASDFVKDPLRRSIAEEAYTGRQFLADLRRLFKGRPIYWIDGNHCERLEMYMRVRADKLIGVPGTTIPTLMDFDKYRVTHVGDRRYIILGKDLVVMHGHEYRTIRSAISPARTIFMAAKQPTIIGHYHRKSEHNEVSVTGKSTACWSTGCLCNLSPDYLPYNNWVHGFADVVIDPDGRYDVNNHYISKNWRVY